MYLPSSNLADQLASRIHPKDTGRWNMIGDKVAAELTRIGHLSADRWRWKLFGPDTKGVCTVHSVRTRRSRWGGMVWRVSIVVDGQALDVDSLAEALCRQPSFKEGWRAWQSTPLSAASARLSAWTGQLPPVKADITRQYYSHNGRHFSPYNLDIQHLALRTRTGQTLSVVESAFKTSDGTLVQNSLPIATFKAPDIDYPPASVSPLAIPCVNKEKLLGQLAIPIQWVAGKTPNQPMIAHCMFVDKGRPDEPMVEGLAAAGFFSSELDTRAFMLWLAGGRIFTDDVWATELVLPSSAQTAGRMLEHRTQHALNRDISLQLA